MQLLFDIGNTRLKWGYFTDDELRFTGSLDAQNVELVTLQKYFTQLPVPESVWISNVGSQAVLACLLSWIVSTLKLVPNLIEVSETRCGIKNAYQSKDTLGVDRWVAAIGARSLIQSGHIIIVDAGTAVTIDWLSGDDYFKGGAILPGFKLMHQSLITNTAGIRSDFSETYQIIGRTTEECVNSGVAFGLVGGIERIVKQMQQYIDMPTTIVLTGGSALQLQNTVDFAALVAVDLVLLGVANIANEAL